MKKQVYVVGHWYRFNDRGTECIGQYMGREEGFGCCVCDKGNNAHCFNIWYCKDDYETWGFGNEHLPKLIEDLGSSDDVIVNR